MWNILTVFFNIFVYEPTVNFYGRAWSFFNNPWKPWKLNGRSNCFCNFWWTAFFFKLCRLPKLWTPFIASSSTESKFFFTKSTFNPRGQPIVAMELCRVPNSLHFRSTSTNNTEPASLGISLHIFHSAFSLY